MKLTKKMNIALYIFFCSLADDGSGRIIFAANWVEYVNTG